MAQTIVNIHASCVVLAGAAAAFGAPAAMGVLLLGESGSGKSDLALRLLERGAALVADDRCDLFLRDGALHARAPRSLAGLIELRGVGIITRPFETEAMIGLAVRLAAPETLVRHPDPVWYQPPEALGIDPLRRPPLITLAPFEASAPARIVAAAASAQALFTRRINPQ